MDHWLFKCLSGETRHNQGKVYSLSVLCTALLESLPVKVKTKATGIFKVPGLEAREFPSSTQSHSTAPAWASCRKLSADGRAPPAGAVGWD